MMENIQAFCEVVRRGSFTGAAFTLKLTAPVITRRVKQLEAHLNTKLLHRTTRAVTLTSQGKLFHEEALAMLLHYAAGKQAIKSLSTQVSGSLKVGMPVSISQSVISPALTKFHSEYPDVRVNLVQGNHILNVIPDNFDVVIHCGILPDSDFHFKKIRDWHKFTCAAPSYLGHHSHITHPQDLLNHHCIDHGNNHQRLWLYQVNNEIQQVFINAKITTMSSMDLLQMAVSGLGVVHLPDFIVLPAIREGALMEVLPEFRSTPLGLYAVYPGYRYRERKVDAFIEFLETQLAI